jgi:hypothetical protein
MRTDQTADLWRELRRKPLPQALSGFLLRVGVEFFNQDRRFRRTNNRRRRVLSTSHELLQGEQRVLGARQHGAKRVGRGFDRSTDRH